MVPEIAARAHVEILPDLIRQRARDAGTSIAEVDAIAATAGPGLIGGVMVALLAGKGLALAAGKPLIAVNHLEGHALSPRLVDPDLDFPYLLLLVSGGHCQLLEVRGVGDYRRLATTIDDAAGEAFDKAAKLLGLGYPGGPAIEALAETAIRAPFRCRARWSVGRTAFLFRRPQERGSARSRVGRLSAGGHRRELPAGGRRVPRRPHRLALERSDAPALVVAGGVAANQAIRAALAELARKQGRRFSVPPAWLCTDNAAMIAWAGVERFAAGVRRARRSGAGALAARRKRRKGARRGGEGMKLGVIGGGAWGTALAQVAATGGRETMLWALRARSGRGGQRAPRKPGLPARHPARPAIRATADLADLTGATPGWW